VRGGAALTAVLLAAAVPAAAGLEVEVAAPGETLPGEPAAAAAPLSPADTLMATFRLKGLFEDDGEGAGQGLAASLTLVVDLRRSRKPFWSTGRVGVQAFTYRFRRDPLDDAYEVLNPDGTTAELRDRAELARYLERVHEVVLATRGSFEPGKEYEVAVTAVLKPMDIENLEEWLSGDVGGGGGIGDFILGIPRFIYAVSVKMSGLDDERGEGSSGRFTPLPD